MKKYNLDDKKWKFLLKQKIGNISVKNFLSRLNFAFVNLRYFYYNPNNDMDSKDLEDTINYLSTLIGKFPDSKEKFWKDFCNRLFSLGGLDELARKVSELKRNSNGEFLMPEYKYPNFLGNKNPEEVLYNYKFGKDDALLGYIENNWEDIIKIFRMTNNVWIILKKSIN